MHNLSKYHTLFIGRIVAAVFLAICLAGLSGCSGTSGPYGRLAVNPDVKALFESNEVLPDHRYFYTESPAWPRVIIGLHKDYTLQSDYWHPVKATPKRLKRWLNFEGNFKPYLVGGNGSDILDKNGRKIGVWYALKNARDWGVVKIIDDKTVNIILQTAPEYPLIFKFREL
jgi:hypothetical protein